jgi:hypothetical protein
LLGLGDDRVGSLRGGGLGLGLEGGQLLLEPCPFGGEPGFCLLGQGEGGLQVVIGTLGDCLGPPPKLRFLLDGSSGLLDLLLLHDLLPEAVQFLGQLAAGLGGVGGGMNWSGLKLGSQPKARWNQTLN